MHQRPFVAFLAWLAENHARLTFPLRVTRRTPRHIDLRLEGIHQAIAPSLSRQSLRVDNLHEGANFDTLVDINHCKVAPGGWVCRIQEGAAEVFPTPELLWRAHVLEPFLACWVNERLAQARWLRLARIAVNSRWPVDP